MRLVEPILAHQFELETIRRDIHAHPELCFEEERTADVVAARADRMGHPDPSRPGHDRRGRHPQERHQRPRRRPARRHGRAADARSTTPSPTPAAPRQDARLRPRRPHRDAAGAPPSTWRKTPQLRRHRLPDLPAGRRRRRRRARDDQGRPVRAVPDGGRVRHAQLAGHDGRPVRREARPGDGVEQRVQDRHPRQGRARRACRTTASTRCRSPARWCRPSRPSSRATRSRSTPA